MGETGTVRFPGNLDPRAQEFRPRNPTTNLNHQLTLFTPQPPPPQIYYAYPPSYPPTASVGYPQFLSPPAYVGPAAVSQNQFPHPPPPLPPPSVTSSRTLILTSVPTVVSESVVRKELEVFGEVRAVQMERVKDGIVTVHFYDLRHAQLALTEICEQHMHQQSRLRNHYSDALLAHNSAYAAAVENLAAPLPLPLPARGLIAGRAVWAQFTIPTSSCIPDGHNQGTIVVFNLDSQVSTANLREIFQAFGSVKELRETPFKRHQKFVEFYDIRDAAKALKEMNGKEIHGKHVVIEFSRPGGHGRRYFNTISGTSTSSFNNSVPFSSSTNNQKRISSSPPPHLPRKMTGRSASNVPPRLPQSTKNKSKGNFGGNSKCSKTEAVLAASMASLCIDGAVGNGIEDNNNANGVVVAKRNSKKGNNHNNSNNNHSSSIAAAKQQQLATTSRSAKRRNKNFDSRFLINEDAISELNCRDSRTTVMIKNIPNKYSQKLLLNMLDNHCIHCNEQIAGGGDDQPLSSYDFVYLPIDFNNKCNVGYGFVNMTSPEATWRLYKAFHLQSWEVFNSRKICQVTYARVQSLEALKEHFKNSKFPSVAEEIYPVVFSPPRDGKQLTEPQPIFGHVIPPPMMLAFTAITKAVEMDGSDCRLGESEYSTDELEDGGRVEIVEEAVCDDDDDGDDEDCDNDERSGSGGDYGENDENGSEQ